MINNKNYKYTGNIEDNGGGENKTKCALCSTYIRYEFELKNIEDECDIISVGCECVEKFEGISSKILNKDKRKFLSNKKTANVLNILAKLTKFNTFFDYKVTIEYFENRGGFTPNQILVIFNDIKKYNIDFNFLDFKVIVIREREKEQIIKLKHYDKNILSKFLTKKQKQRFNIF